MTPADVTVLIPAAGRVPEGLIALSNIACPAMIPIAGRPVIHWTITYLRSLGFRKFTIAVSRPRMFVEELVDSAFGQDCEIRFIVPSKDRGLGGTVVELAETVTTPASLVVLGDTHFQFDGAGPNIDGEPFVLTSSVEDSYRWCIAEADTDGRLLKLHDKQADVTCALEALIGVYYFPDTQRLVEAARSTVSAAETLGKRAEMAGILEHVRASTPIRVARAKTWLDCGNADMQARSHQALLQSRAFNELAIDSTLGTITKRSKHPQKFIDEINYLRLLPRELQVLFPRVIDYSIEWSDPWVRLEYYGYPSLAEVFLFENVDAGIWERVFAHLDDILRNHLGAHLRPLPAGDVWNMYVTKTRSRLDSLRDHSDLGPLIAHDGPIMINGEPHTSLSVLWPRIEGEVKRLESTTRGSVIHGDLCLSNILYDLRSRTCKLIDPRGSFGTVGIYGDPRYDVAKLWHSIHGLYDFIANDVFRVNAKGTTIDLSVRATTAHREIESRFASVFFRDAAERRDVQLITALLFASMPALHYDKPQRQLAMYARALQLFGEYFAETP